MFFSVPVWQYGHPQQVAAESESISIVYSTDTAKRDYRQLHLNASEINGLHNR